MRRQKVLDWMVASITRVQSPLKFLLNQFWFVTVIPKYLNCDTFSNDLSAIFMPWFWPDFWWWDSNIYLVFCTFISRPTSLLASVKVSMSFFVVSMLSPSRFTSLVYARSRCVPFNFSPTWFSWTFLMAYSNAKLKTSGDRASPCFRQFWIGKLPIWTTICFI
jgi:hypothetical protein